jgi:hypothetical protein
LQAREYVPVTEYMSSRQYILDVVNKDTSIAMEEVRRGLISFTQFALPQVHDANAIGDLKAGGEEFLPVVGSTGGF